MIRTKMDGQINKLRQFHNNVKSTLIRDIAKFHNNNIWLDLACGRGGDIFKYNKYGIQNVIGIDIEKAYIDEAINRYTNSTICSYRNYKFFQSPKDPIEISRNLPVFDNISCQFALHYFFENQQKLENLCKFIATNLTDNGYFFGTVLDGDKLHDLLVRNKKIQNECAIINVGENFSSNKCIGNSIDFYMHGTLYFGECSVSHEYLVYKDILIQTMAKYNLKLKLYSPFSTYYKDAIQMNDDYKKISFLYNVFVFKKN